MKTYSESRIELRHLQILEKMLAKSSQFLSLEQPCEPEKLGRCLENYRSWKNTPRKLVVAVNLEAIWFEFWMKGASMTVEIFVSCGWWFSNQLDVVSRYRDRELWLAIPSSLLCPETDRNICIGKQGYVFYFTDFRSDVSMFHSWH